MCLAVKRCLCNVLNQNFSFSKTVLSMLSEFFKIVNLFSLNIRLSSFKMPKCIDQLTMLLCHKNLNEKKFK